MRKLAPIRTHVGKAFLMILAVTWNSSLHGQEAETVPETQPMPGAEGSLGAATDRGEDENGAVAKPQGRNDNLVDVNREPQSGDSAQPAARPIAKANDARNKTTAGAVEPLRIVTLRGTDAELLSPGDVVDVISVERLNSSYEPQPGAKQYSTLTLAESVHVHSVSKERDRSSVVVALRVPKSLVEGIVIAESTGVIRFVLHQPKQAPGSTMMSSFSPAGMGMVGMFGSGDMGGGAMTGIGTAPGIGGTMPGAASGAFGDAMKEGTLRGADFRWKARLKPNTAGATEADMMDDSQPSDVSEVRQLLLEVRQLRQVIQGLRSDVNALKQSIQATDSGAEILSGPQPAMGAMLGGQMTPAAKVLINPAWQPHAARMDAAGAAGSDMGASGLAASPTITVDRVAAALEPAVLVTDPNSNIEIVEKFSRVVETKDRILRVDGFDLDVIELQAISPNRIRVRAVAPGVSSLVLTDELGKAFTISVLVKGDTRHLQAIINQRYPNAKIETYKVGSAVVLTG